MANDRDPVIGIDLGTTNSVLATVERGVPRIIANRSGQNLTPSVVAVAKNGKRLVGQIAKRQAITNPEGTALAVKRFVGRKWSDPKIEEIRSRYAYSLEEGEHDDIRIKLGERLFAPPEISAQVLAELKADAEAFFGQSVKRAVITVPAYFNDGQRQATKDAGVIAGLEVLRILNEPTAAALAYGYGKQVAGKVAVFDLGGGTFDISVLEINRGVFEVRSTGGDTFLGGEDFDSRIVEWLVFNFAKEFNTDLRTDRMAMQRLRDAAEKAKCELSTLKEAQVNLPFLFTPKGGGAALHLQRTITRDKLEELTGDLVERCIEHCRRTLEEAKVQPRELKEVLLVGGMTRMPKVQEAVKKFFGREPSKGVHPEEVVALGAAVQAAALTQSDSEVLLLDVTPQSLGVAIAGGYTRHLIPKNTTVPTSTSEVFNTSKDGQTTVRIMVLQGEDNLAAKNELLGEFILNGLRPRPRGEVEVEVSFDISAEGIVSVSGKDKETGQKQSITVSASGGLTPEELQHILADAALPSATAPGPKALPAATDPRPNFGAADQVGTLRDQVNALIKDLEEVVPQARATLEKSQFGADALQKAERSVQRARTAIGGVDAEALEASRQELDRALNLFRGLAHRKPAPA
jgi:molecular chaperone DnaK